MIPIASKNMRRRVDLISIFGGHSIELIGVVVAVSVKQFRIVGQVVVEAPSQHVFAESGVAFDLREHGKAKRGRQQSILFGTLASQEQKRFILDYGSADTEAVLLAAGMRIRIESRPSRTAIAVFTKNVAVPIISAGACRHAH